MVQMRAFWRHAQLEMKRRSSRVLVTGVPGFLGCFLLAELLQSTNAQVYTIIRPSANVTESGETPVSASKRRLWDALVAYGLAMDGDDVPPGVLSRDVVSSRVWVIVGDISLKSFGIEEEDYMFLTRTIDIVVHAAAQVNLIYPYEALSAANVEGTANMVSFCSIGRIKVLHYVSTDAVFPSSRDEGHVFTEESDLKHSWHKLQSGYSQTKWVAEQLVLRGQEHGIPSAIYRCGNISGHSKSAAWNSRDSNLQFMQACLAGEGGMQGMEGFACVLADRLCLYCSQSCSSDRRCRQGLTV